MPSHSHKAARRPTPLFENLASLSLADRQIKAAMAQPMSVRESPADSLGSSPSSPTDSPEFAILRALSLPAIRSRDRGVNTLSQTPATVSHSYVSLARGDAAMPLRLRDSAAGLQAFLPAKVALTVKLMLDTQCDVRLVRGLLSGASADAAKAAAGYVVGEILTTRMAVRTTDLEVHDALGQWLTRLLEAGYVPTDPVAFLPPRRQKMFTMPENAAALALDAPALDMLMHARGRSSELVALLARQDEATCAGMLTAEQGAVLGPLPFLLSTPVNRDNSAFADETMRVLLDHADREGRQVSNVVWLACLKICAHQCLMSERWTWVGWAVQRLRHLPNAQQSIDMLLCCAVLSGNTEAVHQCVRLGANALIRPEQKQIPVDQCGLDLSQISNNYIKQSPNLLHIVATLPRISAAQRITLADALIDAGIDAASVAVYGDSVEACSYGMQCMPAAIHALLAGHRGLAKHLVYRQRQGKPARLQLLLAGADACERLLHTARTADTTGARGVMAEAYLTILRLHYDHGENFEADVTGALLEVLGASFNHEADGIAPPLSENVAESLAALDVYRRARQADLAAPEAYQESLLSEEEAAEAVGNIGFSTYLETTGPLTYLVLHGDAAMLRAYLECGDDLRPTDLAHAYALCFRPAQPLRLNAELRQALLSAATTRAAVVMLMQVAVRLGNVPLINTLVTHAASRDIAFWRYTGSAGLSLLGLAAEMAPAALGSMLAAASDTQALTAWLSYANDAGDTAFHIAARASASALEKLVSYALDLNACLDATNVAGHTVLQEAMSFNNVRGMQVLERARPTGALKVVEAPVCAPPSFRPTPTQSRPVAANWDAIEALHVAGQGRGMGRHFDAHRPDVTLSQLRRRLVQFSKTAASRFGPNDAPALLSLRQQAEQIMRAGPFEPFALFAVDLTCPTLRGDGLVLDRASGEGVYFRDSTWVRFVMRHGPRHGDVDFVAIYPIRPPRTLKAGERVRL